MGFLKEFKDFAVKGNMMDMAIGIIIGASFNQLLDVLVKKVLLPPLSFLSSGVSLADRRVILRDGVEEVEGISKGISEVAIQYGALMEAFIDFFVIGLTLFVVVKIMNKMKDKAEDTLDLTFKTPKNIQLLSSIEGLLKKQNELLDKE